jgi:hypothetical protein
LTSTLLFRRWLPAIRFIWALLLLLAFTYLVAAGTVAVFNYLRSVPKELAGALVAGVSAVVVATLTIVVGRYFERKKELDALYRDKKTEIYDEFLKRFISLTTSTQEKTASEPESPDLVDFLRDFTRKLLLWSGPEVIEAFLLWKDHLAKTASNPDAKTIFLLEEFFLAIRRDLRHSNKGIRRGLYARAFMREGDLFLTMERHDPNVLLSKVALAEQYLEKAREDARNRSSSN